MFLQFRVSLLPASRARRSAAALPMARAQRLERLRQADAASMLSQLSFGTASAFQGCSFLLPLPPPSRVVP